MAEWKHTNIGQFLKEREGRYSPDDKKLLGLERLNKIDFSGEIHLSNKGSKTDMIIVEPGDLVISGINVAKGAIAVYQGDKPITATIHYSSYKFDKDQIDIEYFKRFVKSQPFVRVLEVRGGIKTEIKPKHFLPIEIDLPNIDEQRAIVSFFRRIEDEIGDLGSEIAIQSDYLLKLRQAVLQEAIEGKLTAEWCKQNPELISGENHTSKLLERIRAEKDRLIKEGKIRKEKPLPSITEDEKPLKTSNEIEWRRLSEVCNIEKGNLGITKSIPGDYPLVALSEERLSHNEYQFDCKGVIVPLISSTGHGHASMKRIHYQEGKFSVGNILCCIYPKDYELLNARFLFSYLDMNKERFFVKKMKGAANVSLKISSIATTPVPLVPIGIQNKFEEVMKRCDELEKQIKERKPQTELLMQSVLREAFEGEK